jgi:stage III sporulation protein AD
MDIVKIAAIGLVTAILFVYLNRINADYAIYVTIIGGLAVLAIGFTYLAPVITVITDYAGKTTITATQLSAVFKVIGTAYLAQFASDICQDAGNTSMASKVEMSARFLMAYFSLPIVLTLFEYISSLI